MSHYGIDGATHLRRIVDFDVSVRALVDPGAVALKEKLARRHLFWRHFVGQQTFASVETTAGQEFATNGHLVWVVDVGTDAFLLLVTLAKLVEEHAVLLAPGLRLEDRVDASGLIAVGRDTLI